LITYFIIGLTAIVSFLCFSNADTFEKLVLFPYGMERTKSQYFKLLTHGFIHGDTGHLVFNMLTLFFFGTNVENRIMGSSEFLIFYILSIIVPAAIVFQKNKNNPSYRACGASGGVSAVLFSCILYEPWSKLQIYFIIPVYFIIFAVGYIAYSYYMSKKAKDNVAHDVHLYGAFFGLAYILIMYPEALRVFLDKLVNPPF
jgi:membrane associated rhomboid family serine protease